MRVVKISKKFFVITDSSEIEVSDFVCEYLPTGNGKAFVEVYKVFEIETHESGEKLYLSSSGAGSNCVERIISSTVKLGSIELMSILDIFKLITSGSVKVYELPSDKKFRLPRKIKKVIKKDFWLYPLNEDEQTYQMAHPSEDEIDYIAFKLGILNGMKAELRKRNNNLVN